MKAEKMFINGNWVDSVSGDHILTVNPATGEALAEVPRGKKEDVDLAVAAAKQAFESPVWSDILPADRGRSHDH